MCKPSLRISALQVYTHRYALLLLYHALLLVSVCGRGVLMCVLALHGLSNVHLCVSSCAVWCVCVYSYYLNGHGHGYVHRPRHKRRKHSRRRRQSASTSARARSSEAARHASVPARRQRRVRLLLKERLERPFQATSKPSARRSPEEDIEG